MSRSCRLGRLLVIALLSLFTFNSARAEIVRQVLPNGLTVILEADHSRPLVAGSLVVRGGSRTETPDLLGLSHYYEHLIFRGGSRDQAELEFRRAMQSLGQESGGYTSDDYTNFGFTAPTANFDEALRRSTDAWMNLVLTQEKVDKERQVVMEEYQQGRDRPDYRLYYSMLQTLFTRHPYRVSPIGRREVIEGASLETFRTFYQDRYVPNQMILALVGDLDVDATLVRVRELWGGYAAGHPSFEQGLIEPEQQEFRFHQETAATSETKVVLAFPIPAANHADLPALELLSALLANGNSSRLWKSLKLEEDLVRSVSASAERRLDPGLFEIEVDLDPMNLADALDRIATALSTIAATPPNLDELNRARATLLSSRVLEMQTPFARAEALSVAEMIGTAHDVDRYPALLRAVTRQDIARVARQYLTPRHANLVLVVPEDAPSFDPSGWIEGWRGEWSVDSTPVSGEAAAGPSRLADGVTKKSFDNGARLLVRPNAQAGVVGAVVLWRGGQWAEPAGKAGLANFVASMLDKGAAGRKQVEIADRLGDLGAQLNLTGDPDYITATLEVPASGYQDALEILADVLTRPTFPPEEREKVRRDLMAEIASLPDRPFDNLKREFYARLYGDTPYGRPLLGDSLSIAGITDTDLREFMQRTMVGSNLVIAVSGPVEEAAVTAWAANRFGTLQRGAEVAIDPKLKVSAPPHAVDLLLDRTQEQTVYNTGWPTVSFNSPDYVPLRAAVALVADRFFFKYVYEKGVAYRSWFYETERLGPGAAMNEMGVSPKVYREISGEVLDDLTRFTREPIPPEELRAAEAKVISRHYLDVQTNLRLAERLAFFELSGRGYAAIDRYPEEIGAVTPAEAAEAARRYLLEGRSTRVAIGRDGATAAPAP